MELSISHSSFRVPSLNNRLRPMNHFTTKNLKFSNFPSKCSTNKLKKMPLGLYGAKGRFSKSLSYGQHYKRSSIKACAQADSSTGSDLVLAKILRFGSASIKFTRPHAMYQAIISAVCLFARVFVENPQLFTWSLLIKAFPGLIVIILARAYGHGLNQIFDVDIDRINKPYLPIPAGELSLKQAWLLVIFELIVTLVILGLMNADSITISICFLSFLFGTFYTVPPFRIKRYSVATATVLALTMAILHNVGILYATRASVGLPFFWSAPINVFINTFTSLYFLVINIAKDLTDVEGDMKHNIRTFPAIFGCKNVALFSTGILLVNYIGAIVAGICMPQAFRWYVMVPAHAILAMWLLLQARKLDKANYTTEACANFNQFLWKPITLEFLLLPFI